MKHVSHYGRLGRDSKKSIGGWCQPAGDTPEDRDAPEDLEEDSGTQFAPGLPATKTATEEEAGGFSGTDPADTEGGPGHAAQTAAHGQTDLGTPARGWLHGRLHRGEGCGAGTDAENPGGVCAVAASSRRGAGRLRSCAGQREWPVTKGGVLRDGFAI